MGRKQQLEWLKFLRQLTNLFALLLWFGAGLSLVAEYLTPGEGNLAIAIALIGVVIFNGIFSYWQGRRAEAIMASFRERLLLTAMALHPMQEARQTIQALKQGLPLQPTE